MAAYRQFTHSIIDKKQSELTEEEYRHALRVCVEMKCKRFKDYHEIYLQCDVLLLADIFENFRETCHQNYGLDPANYVSAPGLAWDAMLLNTLSLIHI